MLRVAYLILGIIALGSFLAGPLLAQLQSIPGTVGFAIMAAGCFLGIVVTLIGIGIFARGGSKMTVTAAFLGLGPAVFALFGLISAGQYPLINDISTDLENPPRFREVARLPENQGRDMTFPQENVPLVHQHYPRVQSVNFEGDPAELYERALKTASMLNWTIVAENPDSNPMTIEGYDVSTMFRFYDDFVIRITPIEDGATLDIRSKSREGKGDFGANARRILTFLDALSP